MTSLAGPMHLDLSAKEVRILVQSLGNCLATCQTHAVKPDAPCEDCDAARALKQKLESHLER
ncbi:hypothetical protein [Anaeromyxobacter oryzae]|uniref:Uncharacterized protein n=1 Tax=Anaeromyxobacter oryzae TaxID=2918170 RepID=A0ABN6MMQ3_9BACT|nr:hypothetical protein [Anaeromyxobacter oryzae]BDG02246.1 hypothetical protein AMOR_12420 [Anaeromyxobacter oryzae]